MNLPNGWDTPPSMMDPNTCISEGCRIIPKEQNDQFYIGPTCLAQQSKGHNGTKRSQFPAEMERSKGIPNGYTHIKSKIFQYRMIVIRRIELVISAWDMNIASRFLRHLCKGISGTMNQLISSSRMGQAKYGYAGCNQVTPIAFKRDER